MYIGPAQDQGMSYCCNRLLGFKSGPGITYGDRVVQPELAQSWETPDAQQFTFHLGPGVRFAELPPANGRALTAADIKWNYEYQSRTGAFKGTKLLPGRQVPMFAGLEGIETPDDRTVVVHFEKPFAPFLSYTAFLLNSILPHEIFDQDGDFKRRIMGTGPWQIDQAASQQPDVRVVFKKNPVYWRQGLPYIDQVNIVVIPDVAAAAAALEAGQVDLVEPGSVTGTTVAQMKSARPETVVQEAPLAAYDMFFNVAKPPLNDIRVRKAVDLALDRDELIKVIGHGEGTLGAPGIFADTFTPEQLRSMAGHDPAQAKQLLTAAGYPGGLDIELTYAPFRNKNDVVTMVQLLQAQLKGAGINLKLNAPPDQPTWSSQVQKGDFETMFYQQPSVVDDDANLYAEFYPGSVMNYGKVDDGELTAMLVRQRGILDAKERLATIQQAVDRIVTMEWACCLFHPPGYFVARPRLRDFWPNVGTQEWPLERSWIGS